MKYTSVKSNHISSDFLGKTLYLVIVILGLISLLSCHLSRQKDTYPLILKRALITKHHVQEAIDLEKDFSKRYESSPPIGHSWFEVKHGTASAVLIVAGHATSPTREGKLRFPDAGTGSLAVLLHRLTNTTVIYTTYASLSDPNFYDNNEFKKTLSQLIAEEKPILVLDLHASHGYRPYDIDFGTMGGKSLLGKSHLLNLLADTLRREGLINFSQDYFSAKRNQTVTKYISAQEVPCIQIEINSTWLSHGTDKLSSHRFAQLLQGLTRFVLLIKTNKNELMTFFPSNLH